MVYKKLLKSPHLPLLLALGITIIFFVAYSVLSLVRHEHYQSFGYDLGINNQVVWRYSTFQPPITTSDPYPGEVKLVEHVELVYALIAPFYWIWSSARMLLLVEAGFLCSGAIALFLLARDRKITPFVSIAMLVSYLTFYGLQNAMWFDVHSASFGATFIAWFLYFMHKKNMIGTTIFFFLAITAKENIAAITFAISLVYFISRRDKISLLLMALSVLYLFFIFYIYFPHIIHHHYLYQNKDGLLSNVNPLYMINTEEKRITIFYTIFSFGFLSILNPLLLLPVLSDLATYFVVGSDLPGAQGLFMHYRVTLTPLMAWAAIGTIAKYRFLNTKYTAVYLLVVAALIQYSLHLPLSYLTKSWFWTEPSGVSNINQLRREIITRHDSIVAQNNILPHLSRRDKIYTLYPEKKHFTLSASPCGQEVCDWFRWEGNATYLFVDTSPEWDIRHLLANREDYLKGLKNIEKAGIVKKYKQRGTATIYLIQKRP